MARALAEALEYGAFAADYIAHLLEQRARFTPQESPLHLTRREDLRDLPLQPPDLSLYQAPPTPDQPPRGAPVMTQRHATPAPPVTADRVDPYLRHLQLTCMAANYGALAKQAALKQCSPLDSLGRLVKGEARLRQARATGRRIRQARFPVIKTLHQLPWDWPSQINRNLLQHHCTLRLLKDPTHLFYLGGVGLGKTPLAVAWGYEACLKGHAVLFPSAIDIVHTLSAATSTGRLQQEITKYATPTLLLVDELGYRPLDQSGADWLFPVIRARYAPGSTLSTSNRAFQEWPKIFNNDSTLTAALLDRLLHHAETVVIEGQSYRMKGTLEP